MKQFLFSLLALAACTVPDKTSLSVLRETRKSRNSPVTLSAYKAEKTTHDKLELRKNNSFAYQSNIVGTQKCIFYAGTFTKNGDSLFLKFHSNYKDSLWTGIAIIDTIKKEILLTAKNAAFNKQMTISKME